MSSTNYVHSNIQIKFNQATGPHLPAKLTHKIKHVRGTFADFVCQQTFSIFPVARPTFSRGSLLSSGKPWTHVFVRTDLQL